MKFNWRAASQKREEHHREEGPGTHMHTDARAYLIAAACHVVSTWYKVLRLRPGREGRDSERSGQSPSRPLLLSLLLLQHAANCSTYAPPSRARSSQLKVKQPQLAWKTRRRKNVRHPERRNWRCSSQRPKGGAAGLMRTDFSGWRLPSATWAVCPREGRARRCHYAATHYRCASRQVQRGIVPVDCPQHAPFPQVLFRVPERGRHSCVLLACPWHR